ncbi:uncharacterized protein LOC129216566 [Uloborus diversus]|uniref:uncharacterized protein LOC129216566 n=1 Tax=Uloborus diversus TaxID=327109 RepID=UPI002409A12F|nr:uncharacterized protein LOC129216566 [Uloborus diversus]
MAREKMFDPAFQKSFTEAILKENKIRVNWHVQHGDRRKGTLGPCGWDDEPDDDDDDFVPKEDEDVLPAEPIVSTTDQLEPRIPKILSEDEDNQEFSVPELMKPVPLETKRLIYKGG